MKHFCQDVQRYFMEIINYEKTFTIKKIIRLTNKEFKLHLNQLNYYI